MKNKRRYVLLAFAALALASPCQAQQTSRQQNATPQQALDKRQAAFQADKATNVTFAASDEDWVAMSNKTLKVPWAYLTGRLKIQGSHTLVKELDEIFP